MIYVFISWFRVSFEKSLDQGRDFILFYTPTVDVVDVLCSHRKYLRNDTDNRQ